MFLIVQQLLKGNFGVNKRGVFRDGQGNFRPKAPISRAEMAVILKRAFHFETKQNIHLKIFQKATGQKMQLVRYNLIML